MNNYELGQVDEEDRYRDDEEIQNTLTLLQVKGMNNGVTEWSENDKSIPDSWKSKQRKFLYAVEDAIDILVAHFS